MPLTVNHFDAREHCLAVRKRHSVSLAGAMQHFAEEDAASALLLGAEAAEPARLKTCTDRLYAFRITTRSYFTHLGVFCDHGCHGGE